jgi:hypothetical protein
MLPTPEIRGKFGEKVIPPKAAEQKQAFTM